MTLIVDGTTGVTFNDSSLQGAAASPYVLKNRIINGDMRIDQRNAGASVTPTAATVVYTLDRWIAYQSQASKFSVQQNAGSVTPPTGYTNYLGATSLSSYSVVSTDEFDIQQRIEAFNCSDLSWGTSSAKTFTLSFLVYSSLTGTFSGAVSNSAANRCYVFTYTISAANTWTTISVTIPGDTTGTWLNSTNGIGIRLNFSIGAGTTNLGTAGSWGSTFYVGATGTTSVVGTNGATWYITGVQLEIGTSATPFERRLYGYELQLCQRYCVLYAQATASSQELIGAGSAWTSGNYWCSIRLPVPMRSTPTLSNTTGSNYYSWQSGGVTSYSTTVIDPGYYGTAGLGQMIYKDAMSGLSSGWGLICSAYTNGAKILYTAEL